MTTVRLTSAQALLRYLAAQCTVVDGVELRLFGGCWAIFGHGNVAGIGEARAECGPVTLGLCQDVQAEALAWPEDFLVPCLHHIQRWSAPYNDELAQVVGLLRRTERPLIVVGGGVLHSGATDALVSASRHVIPVAESRAGKSLRPWDHRQAVGSIGVTGSSAANTLAREADLILGVGTRLQDFTTGSRALLPRSATLVQLNITPFDAGKHGAVQLFGDVRRTLDDLGAALAGHAGSSACQARKTTVGGVERRRRPRYGREQCRAVDRRSAGGDGRPGGWRRWHRGLRRGRAAGRAAQAVAGAPAGAAATSSTASPAWATRSRAGWA
jgi:TPP-dependent trihydroxycyclohexane-1,2-dione (THcHDO) dehydratase